jgi:hypothetical protein
LLGGVRDERGKGLVEALDALEEVSCEVRCGDAWGSEVTG